MLVHKTAIVDPEARLEDGVQVGAFSVIGPGVFLGRGVVIGSHSIIERDTRLGDGCHVASHAVLGGDPQDKSYAGEATFLEIGSGSVVREYVTVNRGCHGEKITRVGSNCLLMAGVHVAHDCQVGNGVIMANLATLAGHVQVDDRAVIGGLAVFHQFTRVGRMAMVGGTAGVMQDVPPFCLVQGSPPATVRGLNLVGLKRSGVSEASMSALKHAFRLVFRRNMLKDHALEEIRASVELTPEVRAFVEFLEAPSKRGICKGEPSGVLRVVGGEEQPKPDEEEPGRQRLQGEK